MKRTVAVVAVLLMCSFAASAAFAFCKGDRKAEVTLNVKWEPSQPPVISVDDKDFDPIPCVYRKGEIEVNVEFSGNVPNDQQLTLSNFRALIHALPPQARGGSWIRDFEESKENLQIMEWNGTDWDEVDELVFNDTKGWSKKIILEGQRLPGGSRRLISYKLEITGPGNNALNVAFDPPWGERP